MILAIWTKSPPKVQAIEQTSTKCVYFKWEKIGIISEKVESWVGDMPISLEENIRWASNRADNIKKLLESQWKKADFYIWMEWWTTLIWEKAYLFWAVYIISESWETHLWLSPFMEVPQVFHKRIYENWEELWPVLVEYTWLEKASQKSWAFGYWSDEMLTRKDQFMLAFTSAISPFYNKYYKL